MSGRGASTHFDMSTAPATSRRRRSLRTAAVALVMVGVLAGCTPEHVESFTLVNKERSAARLPALQANLEIGWKAQLWSEHMAKTQRLEHSTLSDGVVSNWRRLGENVGVGPSIASVHKAFMASPGHKANIVDRGFQYFGVGVAHDRSGQVWTSQVYMQL